MNKNLTTLLLLFAALLPLPSKAADIIVRPGESIADAIKQAREWRRLARKGLPEYEEKIADGIKIRIQSGTYTLTKPLFIRPEDTGTESSPTRIIGEDNTIISGGVKVEGWKKHKGNIYVASTPLHNGRLVETRQLWANGKKATLAQSDPIGSLSRIIDFDKKNKRITIPKPTASVPNGFAVGNTSTVPDASPSGINSPLSILLCQRWAIAYLRIKEAKDLGNGTIALSFHEPESELEFSHPWPQPVVEGDNRSAFTLQGAYEFLNEQDEWIQIGDKIYYYSKNGAPKDVVIPALTTLINIEGSEQTPLEHLSIENIRFEHSAWLRPNLEGHVTLQGGFRMLDAYKLPIEGLYHKAGLENQAWIVRAESAVNASNCRNISFKNCTFQHLSATALDLINNVSFATVSGCNFQDIGGTALQVGDFGEGSFETHIPYIPTDDSKLCNNIIIRGNTIHDATNEDWGCVGISAGYVRDVLIEENHVYDLNYSGICVGWGWTKLDSSMKRNIIRRNKVHDFAKQLYDTGGIYTLSYQPESQIVDNEIYNISIAPYATNNRAFYIYFDEATDGFLVKGNKMHSDHPIPNEKFGYNLPGPNMKIED